MVPKDAETAKNLTKKLNECNTLKQLMADVMSEGDCMEKLVSAMYEK